MQNITLKCDQCDEIREIYTLNDIPPAWFLLLNHELHHHFCCIGCLFDWLIVQRKKEEGLDNEKEIDPNI